MLVDPNWKICDEITSNHASVLESKNKVTVCKLQLLYDFHCWANRVKCQHMGFFENTPFNKYQCKWSNYIYQCYNELFIFKDAGMALFLLCKVTSNQSTNLFLWENVL